MNQVNAQGIIYKLSHYSDRSAVALAFSPDYGKIKLFMPKAYSSKGGFMTFVPGSISFNMKDTSDLHRFTSFSHNPEFYHYTQNPDIMMRIHLVYDVFDNLFHAGELCRVLWALSLKFDCDNYRSIGLYSVFRLLKEAGVMFSPRCECGKSNGELRLHGGQLYCPECAAVSGSGSIPISKAAAEMLDAFWDNGRFKTLSFSADDEKELLNIFGSHLDTVLGRNDVLKSLKVFLSMT